MQKFHLHSWWMSIVILGFGGGNIPQSSWPPIHRDVAVGHPLFESPRLIFPPWPLDLRRFLMGVEGGTTFVGWMVL